MEKKLRVKYSNFKTDMSFNEWAKTYRVSSMHEERTPYYTGNLTTWEPNSKSNLYNSVEELFPRKSIIKTFKQKLNRWLEKTN